MSARFTKTWVVLRNAGWIALAALVCSCAGPSAKSVADWHDAVVAVRDQSSTTFSGVNDLVRETQVNRAANLSKLTEVDFHPALDADSIAAWTRVLDSLAAYGASLSALLSPELAAGVGASTQRLGESIVTSSKSDLLTKRPGLASAWNKLGTKLASLKATHSAKTVMAQTDGEVNAVLDQMARMISDDSDGVESGVYQTVHTDWTQRAAEVKVEFMGATTSAGKRELATQYAKLLEKRSTADAALLSLRGSLLELGAAHSRAAAGGAMDTSALIANIREQTAFLKGVLKDLKPAQA